jgi:preprotein translocase subunit SecE
MKRRKVIKVLWIVLSFIVVLSMVAWTATLGFSH